MKANRACESRLARAVQLSQQSKPFLTLTDEKRSKFPNTRFRSRGQRSEVCLFVGRRRRRFQAFPITVLVKGNFLRPRYATLEEFFQQILGVGGRGEKGGL